MKFHSFIERFNNMLEQRVWCRLKGIAVFLFLVVVAAAIFVPLSPSFPSGTQLDNSWVTGMNEASTLGLSLGTDIVFTFGPYASVYTNEYHRATDFLMLFGGTVLALGLATVLFAIGAQRGYGLSLTVALALLVFFKQKDALFFAYPLLVTIYVYLRYLSPANGVRPTVPAHAMLLALLFVPFGVLPLIKGSTLVTSGITVLVCAVAFSVIGRRLEAALSVVVPCVSCLVFWIVAGQSANDLFWFLWNLSPIVTGLTPAMSSAGPWMEIALYSVCAGLVLARLLIASEVQITSRVFLVTGFALFLFLAFKAGFVRHDSHALTAGAAAGIAGLALCLALRTPTLLTAVVCFSVWLYLDGAYLKTTTDEIVARAVNPFLSLRDGFVLRWEGGQAELERRAARQRAVLAKDCPVEQLDGRVDVYSYRQACLIFSGNAWAPRPVFQSYSAYTPRLAQMNARHLAQKDAPKHILFRVEPIDGRLPSLEDGLSWPLLLSQYQPRKLVGDLAYLVVRTDRTAGDVMTFDAATAYRAKVDQDVAVSDFSGGVMAQVELRPTVLGQLASLLFKAPSPTIQITLVTGVEREFRFVPGMGSAGFLMSPYISTAREFVLLHEGDFLALSANKVRSFRINLGNRGDWFWANNFTVRFVPLEFSPSKTQITKSLFDRVLDEPPLGGKVSSTTVCDGSVDRMNGVSPVPMSIASGSVLALDGWSATSTKSGTLPDRVYVVVMNSFGNASYFPARSVPRPDVRDHFKQAGLLNSGFEAYIDVSAVSGDVVQLFIAHEVNGQLIYCQPFRSVKIAR
jgi:hypothetical protein